MRKLKRRWLHRATTPALAIALLIDAAGAYAATKFLECRVARPNKDPSQTILVTLDDASDHAEIVVANDGDACTKSATCDTEVLAKTVLPSVIRLTKSTVNSMFSSSTVIDIDRSTLGISSHVQMTGAANSDNTLTGHCEIKKVDESKKLL
jgi:hypothetical protein